jgi:hypothetical protein
MVSKRESHSKWSSGAGRWLQDMQRKEHVRAVSSKIELFLSIDQRAFNSSKYFYFFLPKFRVDLKLK